MSNFIDTKFITLSQASERAKKNRLSIDSKRMPMYNMPYLDDCLRGIHPSDLIIIGGDTGSGKTHLVNHITFSNAAAGKKVYIFSLEGDKDELLMRWKWQKICHEYYKFPDGKDMFYQDYINNNIKGIEELEYLAERELQLLNNNITIFDRSEKLDIELLLKQVNLIEDADLIIIDHLHYFNMYDDKTEIQNISLIMREIKNLTINRHIPVILVSHLRKKDKLRGIPEVEDFMGSSNIAKEASVCITLCSDPESHILEDNLFATFMNIAKNRADPVGGIVARLFFNSRLKTYAKSCDLGRMVKGSFKSLEVFPAWASK